MADVSHGYGIKGGGIKLRRWGVVSIFIITDTEEGS